MGFLYSLPSSVWVVKKKKKSQCSIPFLKPFRVFPSYLGKQNCKAVQGAQTFLLLLWLGPLLCPSVTAPWPTGPFWLLLNKPSLFRLQGLCCLLLLPGTFPQIHVTTGLVASILQSSGESCGPLQAFPDRPVSGMRLAPPPSCFSAFLCFGLLNST